MTRANLLLAALLGTLSAGAVADQTTGAGTEDQSAAGQTQTFTELDGNNDGVLDEDEFGEANVTGDFSDVDTDGDEEISRNEYYQHQREQSSENR